MALLRSPRTDDPFQLSFVLSRYRQRCAACPHATQHSSPNHIVKLCVRHYTSKSTARKPSAPSLDERILALATGRTRQELYLACPNDRPNHVGIAVQRHLRAGRIQERDGKLYATLPAAG